MTTKRMNRLVHKLAVESRKHIDVKSREGLLLVLFGDSGDNSTYAVVGSVERSLQMILAAAHQTVKKIPEGNRREYISSLCAAICVVCGKEVPHENA